MENHSALNVFTGQSIKSLNYFIRTAHYNYSPDMAIIQIGYNSTVIVSATLGEFSLPLRVCRRRDF